MGERVKFAGARPRNRGEVLYCRNPRRDGRRRTRARLAIRPSFDARFRSSRRSASPRTFVGGESFSSPSSVAAIVATCRLFRVDRRNAFAARRVGSARNILLFRTALGSTFRPRSAEGASDSSRRRPDRRTSRFSMQAALFEGVEKRWKTRQGRLRFASPRKLATENETADGWTSTRRPAKP